MIQSPRRFSPLSRIPFLVLVAATLVSGPLTGLAQSLYPIERPDSPVAAGEQFDLVLLSDAPVGRPLEQGRIELIKDAGDGKPCFLVNDQQVGLRIDEPVFVTSQTVVAWSWKKEQGKVTIVQVGLRNPQTGQTRYFGYGAGTWSESESPDPTVEMFVSPQPPRRWTRQERRLLEDIQKVLGWPTAQITSVFFSPWDGHPGQFRDAVIRGVARTDQATMARDAELRRLRASAGAGTCRWRSSGPTSPASPGSRPASRKCAPGRNSGANEWSAFGAIGNMDFNCMGRELWVRYPAFDLTFRLYDGDREIRPGQLKSFRLGLVENRMPGIWGGWQHEGLFYKVSVMTIPSADLGNFDLYKLQVQNPGGEPKTSKLVAGIDGPPDLRLEEGVVRGWERRLSRSPTPRRKAASRFALGAFATSGPRPTSSVPGRARPKRPSRAAASGWTDCRSSTVSRLRRARSTWSTWPPHRRSGGTTSRNRRSRAIWCSSIALKDASPRRWIGATGFGRRTNPCVPVSRTPAT